MFWAALVCWIASAPPPIEISPVTASRSAVSVNELALDAPRVNSAPAACFSATAPPVKLTAPVKLLPLLCSVIACEPALKVDVPPTVSAVLAIWLSA